MSGPASRGPARRPTRSSAHPAAWVGHRAPYHLLERLIRGRAWIAVVAFALIGIVAMQLWVVKLNVGIGRAIEHAATLQRENSALAIEDSTLSSAERIEQLAAARGMVPAPPGALHFDAVRGPLDVRMAVAALLKPAQPQAVATATASTETSSGAAAEAGAGASTATGAEAASAGATAQSAPAETPPATTESAGTPAAGTTATAPSTAAASAPEPSTAAASAPEPSATGGAAEAAASVPAPAGATQAAPGG